MKKLLVLIMLLIHFGSIEAFAGDCPAWVPDKKCPAFLTIEKAATEYSAVLKSKYTISKYALHGNVLTIQFDRGTLLGEFSISGFKNVVEIKQTGPGSLKIVYDSAKSCREAKYAVIGSIGGFAAGVLTVLAIILLM